MSFSISNQGPFIANGSNTQKVEYAIREFIEGRGERRELLEEISKLTGLSISEVESSFDTLRSRGAFTSDELSRSRFANHWLVNTTDDDFEIYDSLTDNYNVYKQVLMDMGLSRGLDSITYKTQTEMFRDVKKYFEDNHGITTRNEANNLYNILKAQGLIEDLDGGGLKVNITSEYSSDTPIEVVNDKTKGSLRYYFYLIMEYTVEKFIDGTTSNNLYKYTFLNIGITNDLRKRYRNQGFELLKLYEGDRSTVKLIEDSIKVRFSNHARYNRFNKVTKEQFDNQEVIQEVINEVNSLANQHGLIDITANFNVAKSNVMLPPGAARA
jgi:hypothetical protein